MSTRVLLLTIKIRLRFTAEGEVAAGAAEGPSRKPAAARANQEGPEAAGKAEDAIDASQQQFEAPSAPR